MKKDNKQYRCAVCSRKADELHEVIFGNGNRLICINYNIQVPLCRCCHFVSHGRKLLQGYSPLQKYIKIELNGTNCIDQHAIKEYFVYDILGLDYYDVAIAIRDKRKRQYLEDNKEHCLEMIKKFEV